ncbi:MAG: hypothetical protein K0S80_3697 [Neobacillus sp.]|nr:hypothetical protein [Neobacillus sp.]
MGKIKYTVIKVNEPSPEAYERFLRVCCDVIIRETLKRKKREVVAAEQKKKKQQISQRLLCRPLHLSQNII